MSQLRQTKSLLIDAALKARINSLTWRCTRSSISSTPPTVYTDIFLKGSCNKRNDMHKTFSPYLLQSMILRPLSLLPGTWPRTAKSHSPIIKDVKRPYVLNIASRQNRGYQSRWWGCLFIIYLLGALPCWLSPDDKWSVTTRGLLGFVGSKEEEGAPFLRN